MKVEDIIDGDFFKSLKDCETYGYLPNKDIIILYAETDTYERAIHFIHNNPNQKFKLITHNSDASVDICYVPDNLIMWYAQNLNFKHPRIQPIPIGLENNHWHPYKRDILNAKIALSNKNKRIKTALCQFNPCTYPSERDNLFSMVINEHIPGDVFYCLNGVNFESYVDNLLNYDFCLCPRGNGIDTHRMWEAILLGCIPIVKKYHTHIFEKELPVVYVNSWQDINNEFLESEYNRIDRSLFNTPILTKSYWKTRILQAKEHNED